jgi:hypothetical protein
MTKEFCEIHQETELVVFKYCPLCRASHGGLETASRMTAKERKKRAKKAARARWKKKRPAK